MEGQTSILHDAPLLNNISLHFLFLGENHKPPLLRTRNRIEIM